MWNRLRNWARLMKRDVIALWIAARDPRTPVLAKIVAAAIAAYALSPIDFIPDFIPVFGYIDDVIIVPVGIFLAVRLIPPSLMKEFRESSSQRLQRPSSTAGFVFILVLWLVAASLLFWWLWPWGAL